MKRFIWLLLIAAGAAAAQTYPQRPVHMIVPYAVGGASDVTARIVAAKLSERLGQPIVVDNRTGAGGAIGTEAMARAAPDGYTLLLASASEIVQLPVVTRAPYDPVRDFAPIELAALPFRVMDVANARDVDAHKNLVKLVKRVMQIGDRLEA